MLLYDNEFVASINGCVSCYSRGMNEAVIPDLITQILSGRGMAPEAMGRFVYPDYVRDRHDPFLLTDMEAAVWRIDQAAKANERVAVYGDYDIDGITASAVLLEGLAALGIEAQSYIPDRFEEGYGINQGALEKLQSQGVSLVISVDCGITSVNEAGWARDHGLDLIITDHHAVPAVIPEAIAVINPKRPNDEYPFKDLAGVGVAFKLVCALQDRLGRPTTGQEKWLLDLVALGTVCDVVTLVDENRALVSYGLRVMQRTRRVGLQALAAVGGVAVDELRAYHLGYVLGPRMNAAGRLEHAAHSLELMLTSDAARAQYIALELDELNRRRRETQDTIFTMADAMATQYVNDPVLVLAHPEWSHGVVGIVASKLAEKWRKPTLVAQVMEGHIKGSARSVGSYNMVEALRANAELLQKFGGHFFAAGYTLPAERWDTLRQGLNAYYAASNADSAVEPALAADVRLPNLDAVDWPLLAELELLEPHGSGNPRPSIEVAKLKIDGLSRMGKQAQHLRLRLRDSTGKILTGVGFGLCERYPDIMEGHTITIRGELNKNEYQGKSTIQMIIAQLNNE